MSCRLMWYTLNKKKNRTIVFEKSAEMLAAEKDRMLIAWNCKQNS